MAKDAQFCELSSVFETVEADLLRLKWGVRRQHKPSLWVARRAEIPGVLVSGV